MKKILTTKNLEKNYNNFIKSKNNKQTKIFLILFFCDKHIKNKKEKKRHIKYVIKVSFKMIIKNICD